METNVKGFQHEIVKVKNLSLFPHKKSISTNAQYVTQQKYSDIEVLVINFFPTPPLKLKLRLQVGGIASRWETTTSNPFEPIKPSTQSETGFSQPVRFDCLSGLRKAVYFGGPIFELSHWIGLVNLIQDSQCRITY